MLAVGDIVHYGMDGVCEVTNIVDKKLGGQMRRFFELHPHFRKNTVVFLPVDNEHLLSRVRPVLTKEDVRDTLHDLPAAVSIWVEPDAARKEFFQMILRSGDHRQLVSLVKTLYERKMEMQTDGRKLRSADVALLKDAERLINEEFAFVMGIEPNEVPAFIQKELG